MPFTNLTFNYRYRSGDTSALPQDFYEKVLPHTKLYERAVGFFSSNSFIELSSGIISLIENNGKMLLITSPRLNNDDIDAIEKGYKAREEVYLQAFKREMKIPASIEESNKLDVLAAMIESGILEIKIAVTEKPVQSMYHEKIGIFTDFEGNKIAISGSNNESENAIKENFESFDVFCGWKEAEKDRVNVKINDFNLMWQNKQNSLQVIEFPSFSKAFIKTYRKESSSYKYQIPNTVYQIRQEPFSYSPKNKYFSMPENLTLYDYQKFAIKSWQEKNYTGIFDMATGTGKTLTALSAIATLFENANGNFCVIILCPYIHLVTQWVEDIKKFNCKPIIGFGSSPQKNWKEKLENAIYKRNYKDNEDGFFCFITTVATFKSEFIQKQIKRIKKNILLVADEAHNLGSQNAQYYLDIQKYKFRLALSATLERHFDEKGTQRLYDFFGEKCIEYDLKRAIDEGYLTPYYYYPVVVSLNLEEREEYKKISKEIANEIIIDPKSKKKKLTERGKLLCIMRSRIISGCAQKIPALIEKLNSYKDKNMILIYCGAVSYDEDIQTPDNDEITNRQIDKVIKQVYDSYKMKITRFTAMENIEQRESIKDAFSEGKNLQAIAAIKCLDEGVNIPSIKTAFILASSTNPKEYIQRRGRVLRLYKGKEFAEIYDFITLPFSLEDSISKSEFETSPFKCLAKNELERIKEFSSLAKNSYDSTSLINEITNKYLLKDFVQTEDYDYE